MTDWIKHDGGPQPVEDDVWVQRTNSNRSIGPAHWFDWTLKGRFRILNHHLIDAAREEGLQMGLQVFDEARLAVEADIAKLCEFARLEGIRLGLEAAVKAVREDEDWEDVIGVTELIGALDPATIAKETAR
jgi:hypothetical protein